MRYAVLLILSLLPQMANAICEIPLASDTSRVSKGGDTMTGSLIMSGVPISLTGSSGYVNSGSSITAGRFFGPLTGDVTGNCSGNSGTVTNGVYTTGSYFDPAWIKSLAPSKVDGSTYTAAIALKANDAAVVHLSGSENITGAKAFQATGNATYSLTTSSGAQIGSTLDAAGAITARNSGNSAYSIVASSTVKLLAGGIQYADGTVSTTAVTGGGGGISSMQVTSGTVVGGNIGTAAGPLLTATSFYLDSAGLTLTQSGNAAIIGVKNIMALATATSFPGGTSATSVLSVCLPNSTATWNSGNNPALLCYAGSGNTSATVDGQAAIILDGVIVSSVSARAAIAQANLSQCVVTATLAAGSHSACLATATNDGSSMVVPGGSSSKAGSKLSVVEINTSGSGYSAPASSFTYVPSFAATDTTYNVCRATVTLTTSGGPLAVYGTGGMSDNNANSGVGVLVDGQYVSGETKSLGLGPCSNSAASVATNCAFGPIMVTGLSAGTHNVCLTVKTDGTLTNPPVNVTSVNYGFGATEIRNAAGTGDVSSNGNNNFSGSNTFTQAPNYNGLASFMVPIATATFTSVTTASVTLPSGYSSYWVRGRVQNTNGSAQSLFGNLTSDFGNNYQWSTLNQYLSSTEEMGCNPGAWLGLTETTSNTNRFGASAYAKIDIQIEKPTASIMMLDARTQVSVGDIAGPQIHTLNGKYTGSSQGQFNLSLGSVTSCTAHTNVTGSLSGYLFVYGIQ